MALGHLGPVLSVLPIASPGTPATWGVGEGRTAPECAPAPELPDICFMRQLPEKEEGGCEALCFCFFRGQSRLPTDTSRLLHQALGSLGLFLWVYTEQDMSSAREGEGHQQGGEQECPITATIFWGIDICLRGNTLAPPSYWLNLFKSVPLTKSTV